jgi:hypothetical protein
MNKEGTYRFVFHLYWIETSYLLLLAIQTDAYVFLKIHRKYSSEQFKERDYVGDFGIYGRIILKFILEN